jgi:hypothetical protein
LLSRQPHHPKEHTVSDLYLPAPPNPPDPDFRETITGGHALILEYAPGHAVLVEYGDCEFWASCQCGYRVPLPVRPDESLVPAVERVVRHTAFSGYLLAPHCQCGAQLSAHWRPQQTTAHLGPCLDLWERHSMAAGQ